MELKNENKRINQIILNGTADKDGAPLITCVITAQSRLSTSAFCFSTADRPTHLVAAEPEDTSTGETETHRNKNEAVIINILWVTKYTFMDTD